MVLIVTADLALAKQLLDAVPGEKSLLAAPERPESSVEPDHLDVAPTDRPAREEAGHRWLRHNIYEREADVVLLDVTFGGSLYRAIDSVPRIVERGPRVILLLPFERDAVEDVAVAMGCFDVISRQASDFLDCVAEAVSAALQVSHLSEASPADPRAPQPRRMH